MSYEIFRLLHLVAVFAFAGALVIENIAIKPDISGEDARNLAKVDAVCGLSALLLVVFGLTLWFGVGKPSSFYSANPIFAVKLGMVVLMGLLAVASAPFFRRHRHSEAETIAVPRYLQLALRFQLVLLLLIPLLAMLMARGIGLSA